MDMNVILPPARIAAMTVAGHWHDRTIIDYLDAAAAAHPDKLALTDWNSTSERASTFSFRQLKKLSERIGAGLHALGVRRGDVVSYQLPNWWQFVALHLGAARIGAVTNPLMPIFRERELVHMLGLAAAKVLVVPRRFREFDYPSMVAGIRDKLPSLEQVLVIGGEGSASFEAFAARRWEDELDASKVFSSQRQGPNEVTQILYTSGTTGESKGTMQTANTMYGNLIEFARRLQMNEHDAVFMASPLAHQTGFMYGIMLPIMLRSKIVLHDIWSPQAGARRIGEERCTFTMAATPFLADLADLPTLARHDISSLRIFLCGGAPIPESLAQRAARQLGCHIMSAWGMTEMGALTTTRPGDPDEKIFGTDGCALPGSEVRVIDDEGRRCPPGIEGNLQARGASIFVGYLKRPQLYGVDAEGWFDTGDRARMDADGYIRITGRSKDVIIRGGENMPVIEVEALLYGHPLLAEVAVVAMPDVRLGERACAFVTLKPDARGVTLADIADFLAAHKMAKQYFPERLEILDAMPRTPSGKIQKFRLRETAKSFTAERGT